LLALELENGFEITLLYVRNMKANSSFSFHKKIVF